LPPVAEPSTDTQRPTGATRTQCVIELTNVQSAASLAPACSSPSCSATCRAVQHRAATETSRGTRRGNRGEATRLAEVGRLQATGRSPRVHARDHETALAREGKLTVRFNAVRRQDSKRGISHAG
jgi:hypothetical protein